MFMPPGEKGKGRHQTQKKIKTYFRAKTNFQGFNLKHCKYNSEIEDHVYVPKTYAAEEKEKGLMSTFCCSCLLGPCFALVRSNDITRLAYMLSVQHYQSNKEVMRNVEEEMRDEMVELFNKKYMKNMPTPKCIKDTICKAVPNNEDTDSDVSSEDEF